MKSDPTNITALILAYKSGNKAVISKLFELVYDQLHDLARKHVRGWRVGVTLSPTALVNEAFIHLVEKGELPVADRVHFFHFAGQCMRWLLLDHAKRKRRGKRGAGKADLPLDEKIQWVTERGVDLLEIAEALERLSQHDERLCRVVELRYLVGLEIEEAAVVLGISAATVKRDWKLARAWLLKELSPRKAA